MKPTCEKLAAAAGAKAAQLQKKPAAFFLLSVLAGVYVSLGSIVFLSTGAVLAAAGAPMGRFVACTTFSAALSLVVMAGSELFTGNNLTVGMGILCRTVTLPQALALWCACWLGNLAGSLATVAAFTATGPSAAVLDYTAAAALAKVSAGIPQLFWKGVLCNLCVCLGVWCANKMQTESGKLIMVVWVILVFMLGGFEHSVANMSILPLALAGGAPGVTLAGVLRNIGVVTLGNIVGGFACVALPYWLACRDAA